MPAPLSSPRTVDVSAERLARWVEQFLLRHLGTAVTVDAGSVILSSPAGATAVLNAPFPPISLGQHPLDDLLAHVGRDRRIGILLVRRGGFAVGVADGRQLVASKVGTAYVQGRTKAGGWSQQRFARRRAHQATALYEAAAEATARILLPECAGLDAVVTGGDRGGIAAVLDDPRLPGLGELVDDRVLDVPDPRRRVLETVPDRARAVRIRVDDPISAAAPGARP